jgi:hypothetical protein
MGAGGKELTASTRMRVTGGTLLALPLPLLLLALRAFLPEGHFFQAGAAFVALAFVAYLGAQIFFARWRVDDEGIRDATPLRKQTRIAWSEITWMRRGMATIVIGGRYGTSLQIPKDLTGIEELRRLALLHVPRASISDDLLHSFDESTAPRAIPVDAPEPVELPQSDPTTRWRDNPFFVLGLSPECSRADVERTGQKLLALLAVESTAAKRAKTPFGDVERTADTVRAAMAELRDPERRFLHEAWARVPVDAAVAAPSRRRSEATAPWPGAMRAIGWRAT